MKAYILVALSIFIAQPLLADNCASVEVKEHSEILAFLQSRDEMSDLAEIQIREAIEKKPSFCLLYEYGRHLTREGEYKQARASLSKAIKLAEPSHLRYYAPRNVIGFTYLSESNFDAALLEFKKQIEADSFRFLSDDTKVKVYNNAGYTLIQLGRYDEAEDFLASAVKLGSVKAVRNIAALNSLVSSLEQGSIDVPGVFAAVVGSAKSEDVARSLRKELASKMSLPENDIEIFRMQNGILSLTIGSYRSYPRSLIDRDRSVSAGIEDAYVASLSDWALVQ